MKKSNQLNRSEFLAAAGAAASIPYFIPSNVLAAPGRTGANERLIMAHVGVGGRGGRLFREMQKFRDALREIQGTRKSRLLGKDMGVMGEVDVSKLIQSFKGSEGVFAVILDGIVTQRLIDVAAEAGVKYLVGAKIGNITKKPPELRILSQRDLPQ